jgi:hypothetical protein
LRHFRVEVETLEQRFSRLDLRHRSR